MDLIDTHQHLILRDRIGYAWTEEFPILSGDFTREDYAGLVAGTGVRATIFMETGVDDADYQAEARMVAGMVGTSVGGVAMLGQIASIRPECRRRVRRLAGGGQGAENSGVSAHPACRAG